MKSMQEEWREYRDKIYKHGPLPAQQNKECHQAFFAGAFLALVKLNQISSLPQAEALRTVDALQKEVHEIMRARCSELMATLN